MAQGGKGPIIANKEVASEISRIAKKEVASEISFRTTILINCLNCGKWMQWLPMDSKEKL